MSKSTPTAAETVPSEVGTSTTSPEVGDEFGGEEVGDEFRGEEAGNWCRGVISGMGGMLAGVGAGAGVKACSSQSA